MSDTNTETNILPEDYTPREIAVNDLVSQTLDDAFEASMVQVEDGQLVAGSVVKIDREEVLLDIGFKSEGVIPSRELSVRRGINPNEIVNEGEKIQALVLDKEDDEGRLILSVKRAVYEKAWGDIQEISESNKSIKGTVIESVKGGLIVDIGVRGFLPA